VDARRKLACSIQGTFSLANTALRIVLRRVSEDICLLDRLILRVKRDSAHAKSAGSETERCTNLGCVQDCLTLTPSPNLISGPVV
jgi:hypothetical protein